jgi:hypothetical protein
VFRLALDWTGSLAFRLPQVLGFALTFTSGFFRIDPRLPRKGKAGLRIVGTHLPAARAVVF